MKKTKLLLVTLFSIAVAACGGGGSSGGGTGSAAAISATATTTAQNLTVNTAMPSFSPLTASGGATPYTYSHTGTLPTGLSFSTSTGTVTGTPTATYATASLVFSVKDAHKVVASTTSTVSFTVAAGTGVTFSSTLGGFNSVANTSPSNGVYISGGETFNPGINPIYYWSNPNGAEATIGFTLYYTTTPFIVVTFGALLSGGSVECGINSSFNPNNGYGTIYPICSSLGITFDRVAGMITFASTPLYYATITPLGITASGSLSFTPF